MSLLLLGLVGLLQTPGTSPAAPPQAAAVSAACDALEQTSDGDALELHNLATCYFRGEGRPQDLGRARELYAQASALGSRQSMCALGNMMIDGTGGARDVAGGLDLCRRAAMAGEAQAQTDLANYLLMGEVVTRDVVEARRWYTLAAEQGQANAAYVLGQIYWNGDGVTKDNAEAARWWRVAHEGGRPDAANLLARETFVRMVRGVARPEDADPVLVAEALRWFELAAQTDPNAVYREEAAQQISSLRQLQTLLRRRQGQ